MSSRRVLKAAQAIREVVSMAIIAELKDPRISDVTVTLVEVSPDMRVAKVNVSVMGDETKQNLCLRGLQNSAGYLQQKIGKRIDTRYTPRLKFVLDQGLKHAMLVTRILDEVLPSESESAEATEAGTETDEASPVDQPDQALAQSTVGEHGSDGGASDTPGSEPNETVE